MRDGPSCALGSEGFGTRNRHGVGDHVVVEPHAYRAEPCLHPHHLPYPWRWTKSPPPPAPSPSSRSWTFHEDHSKIRTGTLPRAMASLRNLAISVLCQDRGTNCRSREQGSVVLAIGGE